MTLNNTPFEHDKRLRAAAEFWDTAAASFDDEPDHGLRNPVVREAWAALLKPLLPPGSPTLLDIGCGTGSLSLLFAQHGCNVIGVDISSEMIARARMKAQAAGYSITFQVMDAAYPQVAPQSVDVVVCRHLLWTLPDIDQVLQRWVQLLKPGGRLLLIEGRWSTDAGLHAHEILDALPASLAKVSVLNLSDQPDLWGSAITDERYLISAELRP